MQSDAINWSAAILLSLLAHSMILVGAGAQIGEENAIVLQSPVITRLSFNHSLDDTAQDEPRQTEKQQPVPLKKIEAEPALTKPAETKPIIQKQEPVEHSEPVRQAAVHEPAKGKRVSDESDGILQKERQLYLYKLMTHIESFKYYPRSARKRSLEGDVKVEFVLLDDGYYKQLKLDGEHAVLVKATRSAMESAVPLPTPSRASILPERLEFTMSYSLAH
jgi:protein TonB